ncbi:HigA family addiction module antitoxin [Janthinobacterium sp. HH01]|uniref:HigA family addiction module antitoxin n=1 Tax=Janthinobacterium sp. HH01 TaxID=1198452 RepID=UPI000686E631|nr:HigA family addiction module antitoxin [Janthinobacterium sp. HH01]
MKNQHPIGIGGEYDDYAPREYLFLSYVEPYEISFEELADRLGLSLQVVKGLLAEEIELTAEMAVRLELAFDRSAMSWMDMQTAHSLMQARKKVDTATVRPFVFPMKADAA